VKCCAATACYVPVERGKLFCRDHWFMLSARQRNAIVLTFRAGHVAAYRDTFDDAISTIERIEGSCPGPLDRTFVRVPFGGVAS